MTAFSQKRLSDISEEVYFSRINPDFCLATTKKNRLAVPPKWACNGSIIRGAASQSHASSYCLHYRRVFDDVRPPPLLLPFHPLPSPPLPLHPSPVEHIVAGIDRRRGLTSQDAGGRVADRSVGRQKNDRETMRPDRRRGSRAAVGLLIDR